ncbi:MAG TPA: hypothetical protein VN840_19050 [Streptosporangiaceae bacterium]|nr:hypothetical protein [Streptosporangiaceae bacterium]
MTEHESAASRADEPPRADGAPGEARQPEAGQAALGSAGNGSGEQSETGHIDYAEHAEHAEFAEFAEHAEFAEFAEHAEHVEHVDHPASAEEAGAQPQHHHVHLPGLGRPDGQQDLLWRNEMLHLLDHAAKSLQSAGASRLHRQDRPEPRWPVSAAVVVAIVLQRLLPSQLLLRPVYLHYLIFALEGALLIGLFAANPVRIERRSRPIRAASIALILLITAGNAISAALLVKAIVTNQLHAGGHNAIDLLLSGAAIWGTNVIAFALWYWEFDRGGPVSRLEGKSPYPDLLFPQMTSPELTPQGWGPRFVDYLYLSFTNATAFSPTDVLPLARWAKLTMLVQSAVSLALGALVIARAVNIL